MDLCWPSLENLAPICSSNLEFLIFFPVPRPRVSPPHPCAQDIASLDTSVRWSRALDGTEYMPGLVGLNNMRANDYANTVVQVGWGKE